MILRKHRFLFIAAFLFSPISLFSQFTYLDIGVSQSNLLITGKRALFGAPNTQLKTSQFHIGGLWRFNRFIGVGLNIGLPFSQKSDYTLRFSKGSSPYNGGYNDYFSIHTAARYKPEKLDYTIRQSPQLGFIGRIFFSGTSNVFIDVRVSALKLKEKFVFIRGGSPAFSNGYPSDYLPEVKAQSILENHEQLIVVPGFAIGWQPHLGERFFMNFNLAYDFYMLKGGSFAHPVPYLYTTSSSSNTYAEHFVLLESQLTKTKLAVTATLRFGMFF